MSLSAVDATTAATNAPVPRVERRGAAFVAIAVFAAGTFAWCFGSRVVGISDVVFPMFYAAAFVALVISATILRTQFRTTNAPALSVLSNILGVSAFALVPYVAILPHVFSANGFGFGEQTSIWLWVGWHVEVLALALAFIVVEHRAATRTYTMASAHALGARVRTIVAPATVLGVTAILFFHSSLPSLGDSNGFSPLYRAVVEPVLLACSVLVLAGIGIVTRLRQTKSVWLAIVIASFTVQITVAGQALHGRNTLAYYIVFALGTLCETLYVIVQLRNANKQLVAYAADKQSLIAETLRDALTNLLNRRGFNDRFEEILSEARVNGRPASIVIIDIDHFKIFNDTFGHPAGDDALKRIAHAVALSVSKSSDACCRLGGEEFAMILGDVDASGAMTVAERVRSSVMRLRIAQNPEFSKILTVSVGTATAFAGADVDPAELYSRADRALYRAKRLGRNRIATHDVQRDPAFAQL